MKDNHEDVKTSKGLNQILEIINAKGDEGELREIVENNGGNNETAATDENK